MAAAHSAMHSSQVPEVTSRRYSLPTCAMRVRIRVFAAPARPTSSPVPCPPHRASPSAHQNPIAPPLPRPCFRLLLHPIAGSRVGHSGEGGERKGRYLLFRWVCTPTAHRRTPRLRGIRVPQGLVFDSQWFIPARAGKTTRWLRTGISSRVHPRAGGENTLGGNGALNNAGSSPRERGKPGGSHAIKAADRLIPARAGKTLLHTIHAPQRRTHPRAGGENNAA